MPRPCQVLRVFTEGDHGGNHLGVVNDCVGLSPDAMQHIAADLGFSETVFVDWQEGRSPHARIFTPAAELPFAGHPLVGAAWVLASLGPGTVDRIECGIGEVGFRSDDGATWVDLADPAAVTPAPDGAGFAARAGLPAPVAAWWVRLPLGYLVLELADPGAVAAASPDVDVLGEHFGTYLFAREGDRVRARFFAPASGVPEDPATGSAAVALAGVLRHQGETEGRLDVFQGAEIGYPSRIGLAWADATTSIGGSVRRDEVRFLEI